MVYTAVGSTVNLASQLVSAAKDMGVDILISDATHREVQGIFETVAMPPFVVEGLTDPVAVYSVEGVVHAAADHR